MTKAESAHSDPFVLKHKSCGCHPRYLPIGGIEHLNDLPEIVKLIYHLIGFASTGNPTVTVRSVQPASPMQQPQPQPQLPPCNPP